MSLELMHRPIAALVPPEFPDKSATLAVRACTAGGPVCNGLHIAGAMKPTLPILVVLTTCGGAPSPTPVTLAQAPSASSAPSVSAPTARTALDTCDVGPAVAPVARDERKPPTAGVMTEQAALAKRLYDSEKWSEAAAALERVESGDTGDDEGNKQLAAYHKAAALYRMERFDDSYKAFRAIARNRSHLKQRETVLWLTKLARDQSQLVDPADFGFYAREDIAMFDNSAQREVYEDLLFLLGRSRMRSRELDEAEKLLAAVPPSSRFGARAQQCVEAVRRAR